MKFAYHYAKLDHVPSLFNQPRRVDEKLVELGRKIDDFEGYEVPHAARVAAIADELGKAFNLASEDLFFLNQAAFLHDIGEMSMGRHYHSLRRELTDTERIDLQRHPVIGEQEVAKLGLPRGTQLIVRWHHEWWNGSGYPDRIEGEQIPLTARILRAADTYSSLTSARPFRPARSDEEARRHFAEWAGIEIDPDVARALLNLSLSDTHSASTESAANEELGYVTPEPVVPSGDAFAQVNE